MLPGLGPTATIALLLLATYGSGRSLLLKAVLGASHGTNASASGQAFDSSGERDLSDTVVGVPGIDSLEACDEEILTSREKLQMFLAAMGHVSFRSLPDAGIRKEKLRDERPRDR